MSRDDHRRREVPSRRDLVPSEFDDRRRRAFVFYRWTLRGAVLLMGMLFVNTFWSELPRLPLDPLNAYLVLKSALVLYMYCWYLGCSRDLAVVVLALECWSWFKRLELWLLWRGLSWLRANGFQIAAPPSLR